MNRKEFISGAALISLSPSLAFAGMGTSPSRNLNAKMSRSALNNSYWYLGNLMSVLVSSEDTNGQFSLLHHQMIPGLEPPPHTHSNEEESFYILEGEIEFTVGNDVFHAKPGDWVFLPRNVEHAFKVLTEKVDVLMHLTPGGFEGFFLEMSEPAKELSLPPRPEGPPDVPKLLETASRYGIAFAKPE